MKKFILVLTIVFLLSISLAGCLPEWLMPTESPEPSAPLVMEADVNAVLVEGENQIAWSIENTGQINIFKYILTFDVFYPMTMKDNVIFNVEGFALEIGDKDEGLFDLVPYDTPETVSVSWKLFQ